MTKMYKNWQYGRAAEPKRAARHAFHGYFIVWAPGQVSAARTNGYVGSRNAAGQVQEHIALQLLTSVKTGTKGYQMLKKQVQNATTPQKPYG